MMEIAAEHGKDFGSAPSGRRPSAWCEVVAFSVFVAVVGGTLAGAYVFGSGGPAAAPLQRLRASACAESAPLLVEPAVLAASGDEALVSWPQVEVMDGDYIGIYDGASGAHRFSWHNVSFTREQRYTLRNMRRGGFAFRYHRKGGEVVACSPVVGFSMGDDEPTQLHTALAGDSDNASLRVMWVTARNETPVVVAFDGDDILWTFRGSSRTYTPEDFCQATRIYQHPGFIHDVLVTGLQFGKTYSFGYGNIRSSEQVIWSPKRATATVPPKPGSDQPFEALIVGDMGNSRAYCDRCVPDLMRDREYQDEAGDFARGAAAVVASMDKRVRASTAFVANIGDLSYACGVEMKWDYWMGTIEPLCNKVPFMVSVGNHEYGYSNTLGNASLDPSGAGESYTPNKAYGHDSLGECGVPTARRFHMPDNGNGVFWYSFEVGLAHFTVLSMEHRVDAGSPQREWLEADLASVDRSTRPWLIVMTHRPAYCSEQAKADEHNGRVIQGLLDELLLRWQVNLFLAGHYHAYERTCPVHAGVCHGDAKQPLAPVHVTVGTGGIAVDLGKWGADWSVTHIDPAYGYGRLQVVNRTALRWQYVNVTVDGEEAILDEVWLSPYPDAQAVAPAPAVETAATV